MVKEESGVTQSDVNESGINLAFEMNTEMQMICLQ